MGGYQRLLIHNPTTFLVVLLFGLCLLLGCDNIYCPSAINFTLWALYEHQFLLAAKTTACFYKPKEEICLVMPKARQGPELNQPLSKIVTSSILVRMNCEVIRISADRSNQCSPVCTIKFVLSNVLELYKKGFNETVILSGLKSDYLCQTDLSKACIPYITNLTKQFGFQNRLLCRVFV